MGERWPQASEDFGQQGGTVMEGMAVIKEAKRGERARSVEGIELGGLPSWDKVCGWEGQNEEG